MYDIYIKNYANSSGVVQTTETLLYSIPLTATYEENILINPIVKTEMGKVGTLEFSIHPDHPYYNCWQQMKTLMRVVYDGTTIFRGRVLTIDNTLFGDKKIHCEGDFAFFMDSFQVGVKEETRTEITILAYLQKIISAHNAQMMEASLSDKCFTLGEVPGQYTSATASEQRVTADPTKKYGSDSWETSMSSLEALQKQYGGYFRTRYVNGTTYLDWIDNYFSNAVNTQYIEIGENLINMQNSAEVENIFTALIPIGSSQSKEVLIDGYKTDIHGANNNRILVPQIVSQFTDAELNSGYHSKADYQNAVNKYGIIYKTQKFENADTQEKLWNYACDYILKNYVGGITSFTLTALDMHHINGVVAKYLVGDRIPIRYPDLDSRTNGSTPIITKTLTALSISYNLHNPEKNDYSIGIPNSMVEKKYGSSNGKGGGGGGGAGGNKDIEEDDFKRAYDNDKSENGVLAWRYVIDAKYNNAEYQELLADDPNLEWAPKALKTGKVIVKSVLDDTTFGKQTYNSIIAGGGKLELKPNLDLVHVYNPDLTRVAQTASSIVFDAHNGNIELREKYVNQIISDANNLKTVLDFTSQENALMRFYKKGALKESQNPVLAAMLDGSDGTISSIVSKLGLDGSGEKATIVSSGLTSMLKFFNPTTATSANPLETVELDGNNGKGKVGKDSSSNWQVELNNTVTYVDENNNQQTAAGFVSAKDFNIPSVSSFKTKLLVVDDLIASRATIGELNAAKARIANLEADAITVNNLAASIGRISILQVQGLGCSGGLSVSGTTNAAGGINTPILLIDDVDVGSAVFNVRINPGDNGSYTLQKQTISGSGWTDCGTFSRATSLSGVWSGAASAGKSFKVTASPAGSLPDYYSPALDSIVPLVSQRVWDNDKKGFEVRIDVDDENGETVIYDTVHFNTSDSWDNGFASGAPSGATLGTKVTGTVWNVNIQRGSYSAVGKTIDLSNAYDDARAGYYSSSQYNAAVSAAWQDGYDDCEVEFSPISLQTIDTSTVLKLKSENVYHQGTVTKYDRGSKVTVTPVGNPVRFKRHTKSETPTGNWYSIVTSGYDLTYYVGGTATDYYTGNGGSFTVQGTGFSAYVVDTTNGANYYQPKSAKLYYERST